MMAVLPEAANPDNAGAARTTLRVGEWSVDPQANTLARDGQEATRLEPKAVEVLVRLARRPAEVVGRDELLADVWPGVVVGDDALTQAIIKLRKALGDDARQPRYIETISKRGYRLIAPVEDASESAPEPPAVAPPPLVTRRRWAWAGALAVALLAALGVSLYVGGDRQRTGSTPAPPIVAVLPLANQSGDPGRDYFSDGLTEDLINAFSQIGRAHV